MKIEDLQVTAQMLADCETNYHQFAEERDDLPKQERDRMLELLSSIAASASHLVCALINRAIK